MKGERPPKRRTMPRVPLGYLLSFINEDAPSGDITTEAVVPDITCEAVIRAKEEGVVSGLEEAERLFTHFKVRVLPGCHDGYMVKREEVLLSLEGPASSILLVERTALNIIGRMSGISTKTRHIGDLIRSAGCRCRVAATRKTSPGFRLLDKKAVILGGGDPHRFSLSDGILIKDNHLALVPLREAVLSAKACAPYRKTEVEVEDTEMAIIAAKAGADIIMLDNMTPDKIAFTISELEQRGLHQGRLIEISGSLNEQNIIEYTLPGVDMISIGALTHSVRNFDVSLEIVKKKTI